jgi:hypothetical protein
MAKRQQLIVLFTYEAPLCQTARRAARIPLSPAPLFLEVRRDMRFPSASACTNWNGNIPAPPSSFHPSIRGFTCYSNEVNQNT